MKRKLISAILSLTLVFSASNMLVVSADGVDNNMSEQGGPATMLPDENEVPEIDYGVNNDMSEQGGDPVGNLDDYGVNNDMSEQGGDPVGDLDDYGVNNDMSEQGGRPTVVPSTGVEMLAKLF